MKTRHTKLFLLFSMKSQLTLLFIFCASTIMYAQQWRYLNQKPTGNPLYDVTYAFYNTWFAVG